MRTVPKELQRVQQTYGNERLHLPVTISIHQSEVESLYLPDFDSANENSVSDLLAPLNISNIDWYFISPSDSNMAVLSSPSFNLLTSMNSTTLSSSTIRPMPLIKALPVALVLSSIVVLCICGNILVILSVFTFRPLRTVQNFFIVSLAFSDMLLAIMVMPFHIVTHILNRWIFGNIFCQVFVMSDVLLCTSSILNLCAIALDRYWAISDPIQYARQRTIRRVLFMIMLVWFLSATISIPPVIATILGSHELQNFNNLQQCDLSRNTAYVIYSACGSFYIPALIMTIVYAHVFIETKKRFRERANAAAKLANVTRRNNPDQLSPNNKSKINDSLKYNPHQHHRRHHHKKSRLAADASFKSLTSNGNGGENGSTDDADETTESKILSSPTNSRQVYSPTKTIHAPEVIKRTSNTIVSMSNDESTVPLYHQCVIEENELENGSLRKELSANRTSGLLPKPIRHSKDAGRRSLFKGKSLAALMNERQKISLTRERRLSRTLGIIISVFLLCWLPFFVVYILSAFIEVYSYLKEPLPTLILWLGYMNSACNPLIYTVFNVEFRTAFKRLLCPTSANNSFNRNMSTKQSRY
ncbi:unnamed protein product [Adineta ricciae]|uniref:G-protein coupled receptors family 1 profile domain-containing protein n=1 Tax=Adineta ricciae TaxID=249248 RepID=A0A814M1N2_ADIRI|nr:unnamed protein product [Adineta ricciae]